MIVRNRFAVLAALSIVAGGAVGIASGWCVQCTPPPCAQWYGPMGGWVWCGSYDHDSPQACTTYDKHKWMCLNDPGLPAVQGWKTRSTYMLSFTCTNGDCL